MQHRSGSKKELEESKLIILNLDSKHSLLEKELLAEKEQGKLRLTLVNDSQNENNILKSKIFELESETKKLHLSTCDKDKELLLLKKQIESEKEAKDTENRKAQEIYLRNETLLNDLKSKENDLSIILESKVSLEKMIIDLNKEREENGMEVMSIMDLM